MLQHVFFNIVTHTVHLKVDGHKHYLPVDWAKDRSADDEGAHCEEVAEDDEDKRQDLPGKFTIESDSTVDGIDVDFATSDVEEVEGLELVDEELGQVHDDNKDDDDETHKSAGTRDDRLTKAPS